MTSHQPIGSIASLDGDDFEALVARGEQQVRLGPGEIRDIRFVIDGGPLTARSQMIASDGLSFMLGENVANDDLILNGDHEGPLIAIHAVLRGSATVAIDGLDAPIGESIGELALFAAATGRSTVNLRARVTNQAFRITFSRRKLDELALRYGALAPLASRVAAGQPFSRRRSSSSNEFKTSISEIMDSEHLGPMRPMFLEAHALGWLASMLAIPATRPSHGLRQREIDRCHQAREILVASSSRPPTLGELAAAVGTNEFTLKRNFKRVFGRPPYAFLLAHRLERARDLLVESDQSIKEIAATIGYAHASHFSTAFRRHFGVTPWQQRQGARRARS
ncbi:MAG: transcriptional regulator, AraC family [Myxococcales bacterium]|nr:transcriptional regulator, AraC family [Myxococcales bacterium]